MVRIFIFLKVGFIIFIKYFYNIFYFFFSYVPMKLLNLRVI